MGRAIAHLDAGRRAAARRANGEVDAAAIKTAALRLGRVRVACVQTLVLAYETGVIRPGTEPQSSA